MSRHSDRVMELLSARLLRCYEFWPYSTEARVKCLPFQQHSRGSGLSALFSDTFQLRGPVFESGPLFSITFADGSFIF